MNLWRTLATFGRWQLLLLASNKVGPFQGKAYKVGRFVLVRWAL